MSEALLDNDVVIKACRYSLGSEALSSLGNLGYAPTILTAARFVVEDRLRRHAPAASAAQANFQSFLAGCRLIEPTDGEVAIAAEFEAAAQTLNLEMDVGESLLLAILIERQCSLILTGDKRAMQAIEAIASDRVQHVVACLEQLFVTLNSDWDTALIQTRVCADQAADRSLTNSYGCRSGGSSVEAVADGLRSYIEHLRGSCARILIEPLGLPRRVP